MGADYFESLTELTQNVSDQKLHIGIGRNSVIHRAIIDKNARIGKNVQLINQNNVDNADGENGSYFIREGIILVPKNAIIPDGTIV